MIGWALFGGAVGIVLFTMALCRVSGESAEAAMELKPDSEETTMHQQEVIDAPAYPYADVYLLAKIMQAESGIDWPDWAVMCIGEVVLNRVESPLFPNTIYDVLYQVNPVQYEPVHTSVWEMLEPEEEYIDLACRLLDGERVMKNQSVIWQALFPQGERTVITYYDKALDTTTYFCE